MSLSRKLNHWKLTSSTSSLWWHDSAIMLLSFARNRQLRDEQNIKQIHRKREQRNTGTNIYIHTGRALYLQFTRCGFEYCLGTTAQWPCASYWHLCASVTKQYNLVLAKGCDACGWEGDRNELEVESYAGIIKSFSCHKTPIQQSKSGRTVGAGHQNAQGYEQVIHHNSLSSSSSGRTLNQQTFQLTFHFRWHDWRSGTGRIFQRNLFYPVLSHWTAELFHPITKHTKFYTLYSIAKTIMQL